MRNKNVNIIIIIGVVNIFLGLKVLLPFAKLLWLTKFKIIYSSDLPDPVLISLGIIVLSLLVPLAKCVTAYGLIRLRKWGRQRTLVVMLIDFIIRLWGAIVCSAYSFICIPLPPIAEGNYVKRISLYPSYCIAIFDLIVIFILTRKAVKEIFLQKN